MNEFLTWGSLGTYAGAVLFVGMVTQLFKGVGFVQKIPTRIFWKLCVRLGTIFPNTTRRRYEKDTK